MTGGGDEGKGGFAVEDKFELTVGSVAGDEDIDATESFEAAEAGIFLGFKSACTTGLGIAGLPALSSRCSLISALLFTKFSFGRVRVLDLLGISLLV